MKAGYPEAFVLVSSRGVGQNQKVSSHENFMILNEVKDYILRTKGILLGELFQEKKNIIFNYIYIITNRIQETFLCVNTQL